MERLRNIFGGQSQWDENAWIIGIRGLIWKASVLLLQVQPSHIFCHWPIWDDRQRLLYVLSFVPLGLWHNSTEAITPHPHPAHCHHHNHPNSFWKYMHTFKYDEAFAQEEDEVVVCLRSESVPPSLRIQRPSRSWNIFWIAAIRWEPESDKYVDVQIFSNTNIHLHICINHILDSSRKVGTRKWQIFGYSNIFFWYEYLF